MIKSQRSATQIFGIDYFIPHMAWYLREYEKYHTEFQKGLPDWIFQIGPKNFKSDPVLVYMKNHYFEHFLGRQRLTGL